MLPPTHHPKGQHGGALPHFSLFRFPLFVHYYYYHYWPSITAKYRRQHGHGFPQFFVSCYQAPKNVPTLFITCLLSGTPFEAFANTQEEKKLVSFFLSLWTASALNGVKGRTAWKIGFSKMECMSITAILEEEEERCPEGVLRRCLGCSLISFPYCSFEEEGNETNQRKKNRSFSSQTTTFSCFSNIVCVSMSEVGSGPQVGWLWWRIMVSARARGWGLFFFSSESRWPWRGSGVRGR